MLLDTTHTNPTDIVMHIMDMKILHHHTHLLKMASKKLFSCYVRKGKSFGKPKNESAIKPPSQPLSNPRGSIPTLFRCANQERREDALLHEEDVESFNHEEVRECLEKVEEENEDQEAEDVDQEVEDKDKEPKGMKIVHSASSEATPPKLPSELHFEWVNPSDMNFFGPQHYGLLETDGQLDGLCGVLDKKEMDSLELDESGFITCGESEFKAYSVYLHKLHNNKAKVRSLSMRTNQVWDPGKSHKNQHFWGLVTYLGILASLLYMTWNPIKHTKFKHWWGFIASIGALRSLVHATWDPRDHCNNKDCWKFQDEFKHKPP
ncbi:hypothetical protein PIB30_036954 [Stylosanthes scabra]|uniref:Uncharacterized protein n=1 Tax=Stylosanthes scabra TaxID=79078 RepID=A0ABU6VES4_9FABA|nr:hypothetical protein [Stylosanthes scabra]